MSSAAGVSVVPIDGVERVVLGRSSQCDVIIEDDSVSRRHAAIHLGPRCFIEDLGSRHGTMVGDRRVPTRDRVSIDPGVLVHLGHASVVLQSTRRLGTRRSKMPPPQATRASGAIVRDAAMVRLHAMLDVVAPSDLPVLLMGETGVGKEVFAAEVHRASRRRDAPFVAVNCASIPEALIEGELFGHAKGAFTGAYDAKAGLFEAAHGGTLFLDEIGELPLRMQPKLLRVLETGEVVRLGTVKPAMVDVRVISATNRRLPELAASGAFRDDLFHRLNGVALTIPALRDRRADIAPLAEHFLQLAAARHGRAPVEVAPDAAALLEAYGWPGNVRELRLAIERAVVLCGDGPLRAAHLMLPGLAPVAPTAEGESTPGLREALGSFEREKVLQALKAAGGNQTRAAQLLGVARRTLINKLEMYGIARPRKKGG